MKYQIVLRLLGILLFLESAAMLLCGLFGLALFSAEDGDYGESLFIGAGISALAGFILVFLLGKKPESLPKREGLILVGVSWIVFGLFGAIPYVVGDPQLSFVDAFFEAVSGFTTTGSTIIEDLSIWPKDILLWRATTQWLGGLGILVLFMALLSSLGAGSKFLFKNESSFQASEISAVKIRDIALLLLKLYIALTGMCALGLKFFGMSWFEAITHAFTTLSTAGFSVYNESIGYFSDWDTAWAIECWITLFMIVASFSFVFYLVILRGNFSKARQIEEIPVYVGVLLFGLMIILFAEYNYIEDGNYVRWIRQSFFMVVSLSTTTGFGLIPERDWPVYIIPGITLIMIIGGCAGSTAGGMKVSRVIILWRSVKQALIKAFRPHQYISLKVNGAPLDKNAESLIILFVALNLSLLFLSTFVVAFLEHREAIDFETAFGASVSSISNIGPGFGEVGLWGNFAHLNPETKIFLSFLMILGRLELFTLLALFTPGTWKKF